MPPRKINDSIMLAMLDKGKKQAEVAEFFGVSPQAISDRLKKLKLAVVKNVVLESAHKVVRKNLTAIEQLQRINTDANEILDVLMKWIRGDKIALQVLESHKEFKLKDPRELALKACSEIRGQLGLQLDLFDKMYNAKHTAEFQEEVLTAIGEVAPDVRKRIIERLKERGALRSTVSIN